METIRQAEDDETNPLLFMMSGGPALQAKF